MWIGYLNLPNLITLTGTLFALSSMILAGQGLVAVAMVGLICAGICDLFDGLLARKVEMSHEERAYGGQLDTLNDVVCFGVLPIIIVNAWVNTVWAFPVYAFYLIAALSRLAYFNVHGIQEVNGKSHYLGLPVTTIAMILPVCALPVNALSPMACNVWLCTLLALTAFLFIWKKPIPKPVGKAYVVFPVLATLAALIWILQSVPRP